MASILEASGNPYDERTLIWAESLRQLQDRPLTGQGPGAFSSAAQSAAGGAALEAEHAHHLFLTVAAEYGLVGLTALLALIAGLIAIATRPHAGPATTSGDRGPGPRPALAAALVAVAVHGLLDYPLRNAVGSTTVWLLVGLLVAEYTLAARQTEQTHAGAGSITKVRVA